MKKMSEGASQGNKAVLPEVTRREQAEAALSASEDRLRMVFATIQDYAIFTLDPEGNVTSWNIGAEKLKGYTAEEIIGRSFSVFYPPENLARREPQTALQMAAALGRFEMENWRVRKDGTRFWGNIIITALRSESGELLGFSKVVRDMTERRNAEQALRRQTEFVRLLQDVAVAANQAFSIPDVLQFAINRICDCTGWKIGHAYSVVEKSRELVSMNLWRLADPVRYRAFQEISDELHFSPSHGLPGLAFAYSRPVWIEDVTTVPSFLRAAVARELQIHTGVAFPVLAGNQVAAVLEFFTDERLEPDEPLQEVLGHIGTQLGRVVERKEAEAALRRSESHFRTLFVSAPLGIQLVNLDGKILACNPAFSQMLGYNEEELREAARSGTDHPANLLARLPVFAKLCSGERDVFHLEQPYLRINGEMMWGRLSVALARDDSGRPQFIIGMLEDISTRKQMESDLVELQSRLIEGREVERSRLAQDLHDGPLQNLYGLSYYLSAFLLDLPEGIELELIQDAQDMLNQVAGTLRKICGELRPPTLIPFGLEKAIRSHAEAFQVVYPELRVELDLSPDELLLPERVRLGLYRIYQQALDNVVHHSKASKVRIRFRLDAEQILLEIKDNGRGFISPPRWIDLARKGQLGLVDAARRAEAIGGYLSVEAAPGQGAMVQVIVPRTSDQGIASLEELLSLTKFGG